MEIDINELIIHYTRTSSEFLSIYEFKIPPKTKSLGKKTMKGRCGFIIPIKGCAKFTICGQVYNLKPGVVFHAGSDLMLDKEVTGDGQWEYMLIHYGVIGTKRDKAYFEDLHFSLNIGMKHYFDILGIAHQLRQSEERAGIMDRFKSKVLFYSLIENILKNGQQNRHESDEEMIQSVIHYIESNYNQNFTVNDLSEKNKIDSKRFYYLFQKCVGMCPKQYIMRCRMNKAKELLMEENYNVSDIAKMIGYDDAFHFSRIFKKNTGVSPTAFRNNFGKNPW